VSEGGEARDKEVKEASEAKISEGGKAGGGEGAASIHA
jgi:hypothetical protein